MKVSCVVNGKARAVDGVWEGESLLYMLRERFGLFGSKNACEQGECGSCSAFLYGQLVCAWPGPSGQANRTGALAIAGLAAARAEQAFRHAHSGPRRFLH